MNGNSCIMSPNIDSLKDSSSIGTLSSPTPSRNGKLSPEKRVIRGEPTEFATPDHSVLETVPEGIRLSNDSNLCKTKYPSCSSSTPIRHLHRTPPSRNRSVVVTNPFDVGLTERLHLPICSPSVFSHSVNPVQESPTFRWNIDNLSKIYPADIEEFPSQQYEETLDPEFESKAQDAINRFFGKSQQLLPSPWGPRPDNNVLRAIVNECGTPQSHKTVISEKEEDMSINLGKQPGKNAWTQTILTLPPILPPSVELALKPFFTFTAEQQQCQNTSTDSSSDGDEGVLSTSSLRRKLLFNAESPSSTSSSPKQAHMSVGCSSSSTSFSQSVIVTQGRTFGTPLTGSNMLSPLALSPVHNGSTSTSANRPKSVTRLTFSQEDMAIDTSLISCSPSTPRTPNEQTGSVCLSPLGTAPLHDRDTDEESNEANQQNNKWLRRNKRNLMDISSDSLRMSQNCTPVKSMDMSVQNVMDISQSNLASRPNNAGRQTAANLNQENTFGYSHTIGTSQDTGYVSSCDGTAFQSGATSLFGLSVSRDKLGYEDSLATPWQINPHVVSSTPTKMSGVMGTNYQHD